MQTTITRKTRKPMSNQNHLTKEQLQQRLLDIFEKADHQNSALVGIYKLFIPDWEKIERLEGFPTVGQEMWCYICNLFIDFDQKCHPNVINGGLWINCGFSSNPDLGPWEISFDQCSFIYL